MGEGLQNAPISNDTSSTSETSKKDSDIGASKDDSFTEKPEENVEDVAEENAKNGFDKNAFLKGGFNRFQQTGNKLSGEASDALGDNNQEVSDQAENELQSGFQNGEQRLRNGYNQGSKIKNALQKKAQTQAGEVAAQEAGAEAAKVAGEEAAKKSAATVAKEGAVKMAKAAATAIKEGVVKAVTALFTTPVGWIILIILGLLLVTLFISAMLYKVDEDSVAQGNYTSEYNGDDDEVIKQTWTGVFYQRYSEMSLYAQVDTDSITNGNADVCPDSGEKSNYPDTVGGESGIDACSGESFESLSGTKLSDIDPNNLYQEGTSAWSALGITDANNLESYLEVSSGSLSLIDEEMNLGRLNPAQAIKPVAANCMTDLDSFLADSSNDTDGDGKVTIKDCAIRNYDDDGNAVDIKTEEQAEADGDNVSEGDDKSLYLTYAKSTKFKDNDIDNSQASVVTSKNDDGTTKNEKETGQWDYGLGSLVHYVAVYQPSRVANYYVDEIQYICDGNGNAANGVAVEACSGASFGTVVVQKDSNRSGTLDTGTMESVYSNAYIPESTLYYREWHKNSDIYLNSNAEDGQVYGTSTGGEYENVGIDRSEWVYEPALSTGVPQTEVKYVIDKALTFAGEIDFTISQDWVTETTAEHTQYIYTTTTNNKLAKASEEFPSIAGGNTSAVDSYSLSTYLCYNESPISGTYGAYSAGSKLTWVTDATYKKKVSGGETTVTTTSGDKTVTTEEKYTTITVPGHYEDSNGNVYYAGSNIGKITKNSKNKTKEKVYSKITNTDNADAYTWGATVSANISIHKEGDLQTYAVTYNNSDPLYTDETGTAYLKQYLQDYRSYVETTNETSTWSCYSASEDLGSDAKDPSKAKKITVGEKLKTYSVKTTAKDSTSKFCYADTGGSFTDTLSLNNLSTIQYYSTAGQMGFTLENIKSSKKDIEPTLNTLVTSMGQSTDNQLSSTLAMVDNQYQSVANIVTAYSGQYGVDASLLALVIAEENNTEDGNVTGVTAGTYTAYNMSTRAVASDTSGGSSKATTKKDTNWWEALKSKITSLFNKGRKEDTVNVEEGSKETVTVTDDQLKNGAIMSRSSSGVSLTDFDASMIKEVPDSKVETAKTIFNYLSSKGYDDAHVYAILGNMQLESGLDTTAVNKSSGASGLVQWLGSRKTALKNFAKSRGTDWTDINTQLDYLWSELQGDESGANAKFLAASGIVEATEAWDDYFERSEGTNKTERVGYALGWCQKLGGNVSSSTTTSNTASSNTSATEIIDSVDNSTYKWDPTDPLYGQDATGGKTALLNAVTKDESFGTIAQMNIYPATGNENSGYTTGVIEVEDANGNKRAFLISSGIVKEDGVYRAFKYSATAYKGGTIASNAMDNNNGDWHSLFHSQWTPLKIALYDDILIHCVPFTTTDRSKMASGQYQKLIDKQPASAGCLRMCLSDLIFIYQHTEAGTTKWKFIDEEYTGEIPSVGTDATEESVKILGLNNGSSNAHATTISIMTGPAISTKVAAMKLQRLQVKYDYNIPMVLTAYALGEDYMDTVLEVYEDETGVDTNSAIANNKDTAWMDYRKYVYEHADSYELTLSESYSYDYAEKVLSRIEGDKLYYQKINLTYDKTKDEITELDENESNSSQHTIASWSASDLYDSIADSNSTSSAQNAAHVLRALRSLNKESGKDYITEEQWKNITSGTISYTNGEYNAKDTTANYSSDKKYLLIYPDLNSSTINTLISRMFRWGTDEAEGENDYTNSNFIASRISTLLGNKGGKSWKSSVDVEKLFGTKTDGTPIGYSYFTSDGYSVVRKYGYQTNEHGDRVNKEFTTYRDDTGKTVSVYSPFEGTVTEVTDNDDKRSVKIQLSVPNGSEEFTIEIGNLSSISVSVGDEVTGEGSEIGKSADNGVFTAIFRQGTETSDIEELFTALKTQAKQYYKETFSGIGVLNTGTDSSARLGTLANFTPSEEGRFGNQYAPLMMTDSDWTEKTADNPYVYCYGDASWEWANCTWAAWELTYLYTGVKLPGLGNGGEWYAQAQSKGLSTGTTPRVGACVSMSGRTSAGHIAFVAAVEETRIYILEGNSSRGGPYRQYAERWVDINSPSIYGYIYTD